MIQEDYVSFETAKLLKEKGFNERLLTFYITDEAKKEGCFQLMAFTDDKIDNNYSDHCYLAPTLQMAMKWLREVHGIFIAINIVSNTTVTMEQRYYFFKPYKNRRIYNFPLNYSVQLYQTYEQACEEAIKYCLENLI